MKKHCALINSGGNIFFITFLALILSPLLAIAQGDLLIFPKRLIFDDNIRRAEIINLTNTGNDTATYTISFVEIRMTGDGNFERIVEPDPGQQFASPYLRFFPRRVILAPKESQTVKVQPVRSSQMKDGEYRSHLYFRAIPETEASQEAQPGITDKSVSVKLTPVYGITIPVIIQKDIESSEVYLDNLSISNEDGSTFLDVDFHRIGNMSAYADISVKHISGAGKITEVSSVNGFGIYTPGNIRKTRISLLDGIDYSEGKLKISYDKKVSGGNSEKIAEAILSLN